MSDGLISYDGMGLALVILTIFKIDFLITNIKENSLYVNGMFDS